MGLLQGELVERPSYLLITYSSFLHLQEKNLHVLGKTLCDQGLQNYLTSEVWSTCYRG